MADDKLREILDNQVLSEDVKQEVAETWEKKLEEARQEERQKLKKEFSERFEYDKNQLIESMDRMLNDTIQKEIEEFREDKKSLDEQKAKYARAVREAQKRYNKKLAEHMEQLQGFISKTVESEMKEFHTDRRKLKEQKKEVARKLKEGREQYRREASQRVKKLEDFVFEQLSKEVGEFHQDKKALEEARVKMITEGKQKIHETRRQFVKRAARMVDSTINDVLNKEMSQLHEDIKESRKNDFGRRIFEAFSNEFMSSQLSEGTKLKELEKRLEEKESKLQEAQEKLKNKEQLLESANRKSKLMEEKSKRKEIINELTSKLDKRNKQLMEELLEGVKTENLRSAFNSYLPKILNESDSGSSAKRVSSQGNSSKKQKLNETKGDSVPVRKEVTGDRKNNLNESIKNNSETESNEEDQVYTTDLLRLAGLKK